MHRLAWQGSAMHLKAGGEGLREGGGGEERVEEEEEEVVGCCSGYVLRNHQLMQRKKRGLWIGPHLIRGSSSKHSTEIHSSVFHVSTCF